MRLTQLAEPLEDGRWRCNVCQWRCQLLPGDVGRCLVRVARADGIVVENDGLISAANVGSVESHRLWHCFPGSPVLAIGGWGYAFPTDQQRGQYGHLPEDASKRRYLTPERAANFALERLCRGVVWTFSDPSIAHEYVLGLLQSCRAHSRYTALVTSSYATIEALDKIGPYLDAISLDLRGFDDIAYRRLAGIEHWRGILESAAHAKQSWHCHIEVTTRLHPQVNDAPEHMHALAVWIRDTLGIRTPWHVLPGDAGAAAAATVARAQRIGRETGLRFIYGSNPNQNTLCPSCGRIVIERTNAGTHLVGLQNGRCIRCGEDMDIRTSLFKR